MTIHDVQYNANRHCSHTYRTQISHRAKQQRVLNCSCMLLWAMFSSQRMPHAPVHSHLVRAQNFQCSMKRTETCFTYSFNSVHTDATVQHLHLFRSRYRCPQKCPHRSTTPQGGWLDFARSASQTQRLAAFWRTSPVSSSPGFFIAFSLPIRLRRPIMSSSPKWLLCWNSGS